MPKEKVDTVFLQDLISSYRSKITSDSKVVDIITFAESMWGLGKVIELLPMQKFLLKVFYGLPLNSSEKYIPIYDDTKSKLLGTLSETECMDFLIEERRTNLKDYHPGETRGELVLVGGRRGSKSTITSVVCCYEYYRLLAMGDPQSYYGFPKGQEIRITTIATTDQQSSTLYDMIRSKVLGSTYLRDKVKRASDNQILFETENDKINGLPPSLSITCGSPQSATLRSGNNIVIVMDEVAFLPVTGKLNGAEIYGAFKPSTQTFVPKGKERNEGKRILLSSPYAKSGLFWDKYNESFDNTDTMLMFQFYSAMMNPKFDSLELIAEKKKDKVKFDCEYGAQFSDTICSWLDTEEIHKCVTDERKTNLPSGKKGYSYFMGIDYGAKNDGAAVAICHKEEDDVIVLDYAEVFYGKDSDVWDSQSSAYSDCTRVYGDVSIVEPSMFVDEIKKLCQKFDVVEGWIDQFNGYGMMDLLKSSGLSQFEMKSVTNVLNLTIYQTLKSLMNVGKVRLFNHPILVPELESLEERKDRNVAIVQAPQRSGYHDDISDAFARSVYTAYNSKRGTTKIKTIGISGGRGMMSGSGDYRAFQFKKFKMHSGESIQNIVRGMR